MANKYRRVFCAKVEGVEPGMPQGICGHAGHQEMRLIDGFDQFGWNRAARVVEMAVRQQASLLGIGLATNALLGIVIEAHIEALWRHFGRSASTLGNQLPKLLKAVSPGQAAS